MQVIGHWTTGVWTSDNADEHALVIENIKGFTGKLILAIGQTCMDEIDIEWWCEHVGIGASMPDLYQIQTAINQIVDIRQTVTREQYEAWCLMFGLVVELLGVESAERYWVDLIDKFTPVGELHMLMR